MRNFLSLLLFWSFDRSYGFQSTTVGNQGLWRQSTQAHVTFTMLHAKGHNSTANSLENEEEQIMVSPAILIGDMMAIALASQLLGLVDVLDNPDFWKNGGWLQPMNVASSASTLPILVQRFSILSLAWIFLAAVFNGLGDDSVETPEIALQSALKLLVPFSLTVILLEVAESTLSAAQMDIFDVARICYFAASFIIAGRYVISRIPIV